MSTLVQQATAAINEALGKAFASLGTFWVSVPTPNLTGGESSGETSATFSDPGVVQLLGWVQTIGLWIAAVSLVVAAVILMLRPQGAIGRIGWIMAGVSMIVGAGALVSMVVGGTSSTASPTVAFIRSATFWWTMLLAVLGVIVGGIRVVMDQRGQALRDTAQSLLTLIVVSLLSVAGVGIVVTALDTFAVNVLNAALACDVNKDTACFGSGLMVLLGPITAGGVGLALVIILGIFAVLFALGQVVMMLVRSVMLVLLVGMLPVTAAATNTEMGKQAFKKAIGWLVAFALYKPLAALVFATAFKLIGSIGQQDGLLSAISGVVLLLFSMVALPALLRFMAPVTAAVAAGGGGGALMAAAIALPTGAQMIGQMRGGSAPSGAGPGGTGSPASTSPTGTGSAQPGPAGSPGGSGPSGGTGPGGGTGAPGTGTPGTAGGSGPAGGPGLSGTAGATGAGSTGAAGTAGAAGGAGATGAAAAAGPVGAAVAAGAGAVQAVKGAAQGAADQTTGGTASGAE